MTCSSESLKQDWLIDYPLLLHVHLVFLNLWDFSRLDMVMGQAFGLGYPWFPTIGFEPSWRSNNFDTALHIGWNINWFKFSLPLSNLCGWIIATSLRHHMNDSWWGKLFFSRQNPGSWDDHFPAIWLYLPHIYSMIFPGYFHSCWWISIESHDAAESSLQGASMSPEEERRRLLEMEVGPWGWNGWSQALAFEESHEKIPKSPGVNLY